MQPLPSSVAPPSTVVGTLTGWGPELRSALQFPQESKGSHPNRDHLKVAQEAAKVVFLCSLKGKTLWLDEKENTQQQQHQENKPALVFVYKSTFVGVWMDDLV